MNGKNGCLLIHGFGGSPDEISPLAAQLKEAGCHVACPVLKGHTGKRRDLKGISYKEWIASAEEELQALFTRCNRVYLIGFSMGGLISLDLAAKYKVAGVVTLNTPIYYWDLKRIALNIIGDIKRGKPDHLRYYLQSSTSFPVSALLNFRILLTKTKPKLAEIQCPIFVAQALEDDTVRKSSALYIQRHAASDQKFLRFYENSGHLILWSKASAQVIQDVREFLSNLSGYSMEASSRKENILN